MIEAAVIAMTVMGCNHQSEDCKVIAQPPQVWQSQDACDAAIPKAIEGSLQAPYPVIVARCKTKPVKSAEARPQSRKIGTPTSDVQIVELPAPKLVAPQDNLKSESADAETSNLPPLAKVALEKTTEGWTLVRKSAVTGIDRVSDGVKTGVGHAVDGVKTVVDGAVGLAERGADAVRDVLKSKD